MTGDPINLAVLVGCVHDGPTGWAVTDWFTGWAEARLDVVIRVVDLHDYPLPLGARGAAYSRKALVSRLANAEAVVVVTSEHNGSLAAELKDAIDWSVDEWAAKPVGVVTYGDQWAVADLWQILHKLGALVGGSVDLGDVRTRLDRHGRAQLGGHLAAGRALVDRLAWWGHEMRGVTCRTGDRK